MNKDITNHNDKGEHHGYQQWYDIHGLWYRGNHKNDKPIGYTESNYKNDKPIGYTESNWNTKIGLVEKIEIEFYIK